MILLEVIQTILGLRLPDRKLVSIEHLNFYFDLIKIFHFSVIYFDKIILVLIFI